MEESHACCRVEKNLVGPDQTYRRTSFPRHTPIIADWYDVGQVTIDMVPDLALLEIFGFYMAEALNCGIFRRNREVWIILAHVCRKWRDIVFGSPHRLNVRLFFKPWSSVSAMLDTWPPLLIDIWGRHLREWNMDNIVAALEHTDRIDKIELWDDSRFHIEQALAAMQ